MWIFFPSISFVELEHQHQNGSLFLLSLSHHHHQNPLHHLTGCIYNFSSIGLWLLLNSFTLNKLSLMQVQYNFDITPWSIVLLKKLIVTQLVKKFVFGIQMFTTVFIRACYFTVLWESWIYSRPFCTISSGLFLNIIHSPMSRFLKQSFPIWFQSFISTFSVLVSINNIALSCPMRLRANFPHLYPLTREVIKACFFQCI